MCPVWDYLYSVQRDLCRRTCAHCREMCAPFRGICAPCRGISTPCRRTCAHCREMCAPCRGIFAPYSVVCAPCRKTCIPCRGVCVGGHMPRVGGPVSHVGRPVPRVGVRDVTQLVERRTGTPLRQVRFPSAAMDFSPRANLQILLRSPSRPGVQSYALTPLFTLKTPNIGSHTFVWTHENTARTVRNG